MDNHNSGFKHTLCVHFLSSLWLLSFFSLLKSCITVSLFFWNVASEAAEQMSMSPQDQSPLPSFKVHLMEPVLLLTACRLPSNVDTNSKVSGSVTVLGLPKTCSERWKNGCGQCDSSSWVCTTTDQPPLTRKVILLRSTTSQMKKPRLMSWSSHQGHVSGQQLVLD